MYPSLVFYVRLKNCSSQFHSTYLCASVSILKVNDLIKGYRNVKSCICVVLPVMWEIYLSCDSRNIHALKVQLEILSIARIRVGIELYYFVFISYPIILVFASWCKECQPCKGVDLFFLKCFLTNFYAPLSDTRDLI